MARQVYILQIVSPKSKEILSHDHNIGIIFKKISSYL